MKPKTVKIIYSPIFLKGLKKLPKDQVKFLERKEYLFRNDPFSPSLKTHKLRGGLEDFYSFSVSYHWRIVLHFEKENTVVFDAIGTHEVYK